VKHQFLLRVIIFAADFPAGISPPRTFVEEINMPFRRRALYWKRYFVRRLCKVVRRYVRRTISAFKETKWHLDSGSAINVLNAGHIYGMLKIGQGSDANDREGSVVKPVGIDLNLAITANVTSDQQIL